jgi:subfamily B ATP-binding cassette protein MsbA
MRLFKYLRPYLPQLFGAAVCTAFVTGCTLAIAPLAGLAFAAIGNKDLFLLNIAALSVIGVYLLKGIFLYGQEYLSYLTANRVTVDLRVSLYEHLQTQSLDFYSRWHTGEIISRMMNDIASLQNTILTAFASLIPQSILLIGLLVYIFYLNWGLSLLTLIALPLIVQAIRMFGAEIRHISEKVQQKAADLTSQVQETISQIRVVKAFTMEKEELKKFAAENEKSFNINLRAGQILATQNPVIALLQASAAISIVWFGGLQIIRGDLTLPQLVSFATALGIMTDPGSTLSKAFTVFQQGLASAKRIFDVLDVKPSIIDKKGAREISALSGEVEFRGVFFAYEKEPVLENIHLKVKAGESIALVGRTGAGKSTLANLIPRFYDPTAGSITVDGIDLREIKLASLRARIAIVPQDIALFSGSIRDNIAYGKPGAAEEEIIRAAQQANIHAFIAGLPEGYDTEAGERGTRLSGGEKQRIAIARAILRNPRILILDEATSSLDAETENLIRDALEKLMRGRTTFIIAHRLSTIEKANRIIVIDKKQIVEAGTHRELLDRNGLYKYLFDIQFKNA